ncbi:signal recognition particle protein [Hortaea werneckii]|nr:signal recognition particle protein [Hortaea werneckii]
MSVPDLASLLKQADIEDHDEVLKAAQSKLKQSKTDAGAQHARVVALLKLDRFEDAIDAFESAGDRLKEQAGMEYAYALYKTGKPSQAAEVARKGAARGHRHVEAQASYRTEDFKRAAELYQQLAARLEDDAEADLRINSSAVDAQLEWAGHGDLAQKKKPGREDLEAFETAYNAACGSIARGELGQAEVLLKRTKDICNALEDMTEEEKQAELVPITVQQIHVLARQGRTAEAEELSKSIDAKSIDAKSIPDASTRHIAEVNSIAASASPANPFIAQRLISRELDSLKPDLPFEFQSAIFRQNQSAVDLQSMKFGGTADATAEAISKQQGPSLDGHINSLSVVNAAANAKNQTGKEALKYLLPLLERRPNDVGLVLTIVQLYVVSGNAASAVTLFEAFLTRLEEFNTSSDVRFAPAIVGTAVSLYYSLGRKGHAQSEFAKSARHWLAKPKERSAGVVHLLKGAGSALLESEDTQHEQMASEIFSELHKLDDSDHYAAAGLLAASPEKASPAQTQSLQPVDRLIAGVDVDVLENAGIAQPPSSQHAAVNVRKRPAEDLKPKKRKKLPKSRIPKDFDPDKKPDPERWLPLRDRSTYRPKGKKGKAKQNLYSQGAAPSVESESSRPGTPAAEVVKGKQQGGGGGGKKKKGKGGKW